EVDEADDARVVEARGGDRLGGEAGEGVAVADQPAVEELDGDAPAEVDVLADEHLAHAAGGKELDHPVVADHRARGDRRAAGGRGGAAAAGGKRGEEGLSGASALEVEGGRRGGVRCGA